jgi:hypothetical protein
LFEVKIKNKPNIFFPKSFSDELEGVWEAPTSAFQFATQRVWDELGLKLELKT